MSSMDESIQWLRASYSSGRNKCRHKTTNLGGTMNLFFKAKRLVAFTALTLTLTLSSASIPQHAGALKFGAGSTSAAALRFRVVWYFSDATHTTRVGIAISQFHSPWS